MMIPNVISGRRINYELSEEIDSVEDVGPDVGKLEARAREEAQRRGITNIINLT